MTGEPNTSLLEDVLDAFAVEPNHDRETLERYLREYPDFALALIDLSRELSRSAFAGEEELSADDFARINSAWTTHVSSAPHADADPLSSLSVSELRELAKNMDVPRQVISAFREKRVVLLSVPKGFLTKMAYALKCAYEALESSLSPEPTFSAGRSHKSDVKPTSDTLTTFEQLLIDAEVPPEKRQMLMADDG